MKTATALISLRGSGHINLWMEDDESIEDLNNMDDKELVGRIIDFREVVDNCLDDDDIEFDDIVVEEEND